MSEQSDRLKKARIDAGFARAAEAASALGVPYGTYSAHENGSRGFGAKAADRYAKKFKVSPAWLMVLDEKPARTPSPPPKDLGTKTVPFSGDDGLPVLGEVAAGAWLEIDALADPEHPLFTANVPLDSRYPPGSVYGLLVRGTSINKIAEDGEILVCLSLANGFDVADSDLVIVERRRAQEGLLEVTAKRVRIAVGGGIELWPESDDPRWQTPLRFEHEDEQDIRILARVEWIYRSPRKR